MNRITMQWDRSGGSAVISLKEPNVVALGAGTIGAAAGNTIQVCMQEAGKDSPRFLDLRMGRDAAEQLARKLAKAVAPESEAGDSRFDEIMASIAQGVINITEPGHATIMANSRVHNAMIELCELVHEGKVGVLR